MDDGLIYIIDETLGPAQTITSTSGFATFAPHSADDIGEDTDTGDAILNGLPPLGERILGVGYNEVEERLYYAIWNRDILTATGVPAENQIFSVPVLPDGTIPTGVTPQLEVTQVDNTYGGTANQQMPVADIVFSQDGKTMLRRVCCYDR